MNIFVGNLSPETTEQNLQTLFSSYGEVKAVRIMLDNYTRRSRCFGFVEMIEKTHAEKAIEQLHNTSFQQKSLVVNEAKPKNSEFRNNLSDSRSSRRY